MCQGWERYNRQKILSMSVCKRAWWRFANRVTAFKSIRRRGMMSIVQLSIPEWAKVYQVLLPILLNDDSWGKCAWNHKKPPATELLHLNQLSITIVLQHLAKRYFLPHSCRQSTLVYYLESTDSTIVYSEHNPGDLSASKEHYSNRKLILVQHLRIHWCCYITQRHFTSPQHT